MKLLTCTLNSIFIFIPTLWMFDVCKYFLKKIDNLFFYYTKPLVDLKPDVLNTSWGDKNPMKLFLCFWGSTRQMHPFPWNRNWFSVGGVAYPPSSHHKYGEGCDQTTTLSSEASVTTSSNDGHRSGKWSSNLDGYGHFNGVSFPPLNNTSQRCAKTNTCLSTTKLPFIAGTR